MHRWRVGATQIVRIDAANLTLPTDEPVPAWAVPDFTPTVDQTPLAFTALAIRAGDRRIVVDPWIVDDSPRARPDATAVVDALLEQLADAGFPAEDVDTVIATHVDGIGWHTRPGPDGAGWVPTFPHARYLFPAAELDDIANGVEVFGGEHVGPLLDAGVVDRVDAGARPYAVTAEVTLHDCPGHNSGHHLVRVESGGALAVYPGHLVVSLRQLADPTAADADVDAALATGTRRALFAELADRGGLLLTTLIGGPGGGRVERHGDGYALRAAHDPA